MSADYGNSPLHLAAVMADAAAVRRLLDAGDDAAAQNKFGYLPEEVTDDKDIRATLTAYRKSTTERLQRDYAHLLSKYEALETEHTALVDQASRLEYQNEHLIRALDEIEAKNGLPPLPPLMADTEEILDHPSSFPTSFAAAAKKPIKKARTNKETKINSNNKSKDEDKDKDKKNKGNNKKNNKTNKGNNKTNKGKAGKKKAAAPYTGPMVGRVDIRVGKIVKVWKHPDSEKLWCEHIDLGEDAPRQILSGLRQVYPSEEEMLNRRVLVVCNVKASKMGGLSSAGFVLCAKKADKVEFIAVPDAAKTGERIFPESLKGDSLPDPYSASAMKKKKIMKKVVLKTAEGACADGSFAVTCDGQTLMTSAGPCTAPTLGGADIV